MLCFNLNSVSLVFILVTAIVQLVSSQTEEKPNNLDNIPRIIWYNSLYPHGDVNFTEISCPTGRCISFRRRKYKKLKKTPVAFIFYGTDFEAQSLPFPRRKNHVWALLHEESPMNNFIFSHKHGIRLFNFTATFSRHSDFPLSTQFIPSIDYLIKRIPVSIKEKNKFRKEDGTAAVLYLQSHCNVASDRDAYVKELMQHIPVDSYGNCLQNKELPRTLRSTETYNSEELFSFISKYKFHIAFENAICDDYMTEKLFRALHVGSVPIYKGSPVVKDWMPSNHSIIVADDFESPQKLAEYLLKLDGDDALYSQYLQYKSDGITNNFLSLNIEKRTWGVHDPDRMDFIQGFECFVCGKIQKNIKDSSIANQNHMQCPQPHPSVYPKNLTFRTDGWLQDWIEDYWFAYDQAKAIQTMIDEEETDSSFFREYIAQLKYPTMIDP